MRPLRTLASTPARATTLTLLAAFALCGLLAAVAPVAAQAPMSSGTLTAESIGVTKSILLPGESAGLSIQAVRSCNHAGQVLPAGTLQVHAVTQSGVISITGPTSVAMAELICAEMPRQHVRILLNATARSDIAEAYGENFTKIDEHVVFQLHTDAAMFGSPPPQDAVVSTLFVVQAPAKASSVMVDGEEQVSPGGGFVAGLAILGLAAFALRRRMP